MDLEIKNKVALVAGSSRGIGKAIARSLLAEGAKVVVTGRGEEDIRACKDEFGEGNVLCLVADMVKADDIRNVVSKISTTWGAIDLLVANIGSGRGKPGWNAGEDQLLKMWETNFLASVRLVTEVLPGMVEKGTGSILLVSSIAGIETSPAPLAYSSAKAALLNYTKNLSVELAPRGIRVNAIAPGNILFPGGSWEKHLETRKDEVLKYIETNVPMKRFGTPQEIADAAAFLCSARAAFITGACLVADGGQTHGIS